MSETKITEALNKARKELLDTGIRNRLVHVNLDNKRASVVNVVGKNADTAYRLLSTPNRALVFVATDEPSSRANADSQLPTSLAAESLRARLGKMARAARTAEDEGGVNLLHLALGFLTWFEANDSQIARTAPLVLVPVNLRRAPGPSGFTLSIAGDDIQTNSSLAKRLSEFGVTLPNVAPDDEDWTPSRYAEQVATAIGGQARWLVSRDTIQLGFFSFSKLLMHVDLDPEKDGQALVGTPLIQALLRDGFAHDEPMFSGKENLDDRLPPDRLLHVVDADASQAKVIEEARAGRNLVVQGPPGTGKSQTIANIIAAAAHDGKRVLFVAEKIAALSVVHERLKRLGLADLCLELHSRTAQKKAVLAELRRTLDLAPGAAPDAAQMEALRAARDRLNELDRALHAPIGKTGETAFSVISRQSRLVGQGAPPPSFRSSRLATMTREEEAGQLEGLRQYGVMLGLPERAGDGAFAGVRNRDLQPAEQARLRMRLEEAQVAIASFVGALRETLDTLLIDRPLVFASVPTVLDLLERLADMPTNAGCLAPAMLATADLPRLRAALRAGAMWRRAHDETATLFKAAAFTTPTTLLSGPLQAGIRSRLRRFGRSYRRASGALADLLIGRCRR